MTATAMSSILNTRSDEQNGASIPRKEVSMKSNPTFSFFASPIQNLNPSAEWSITDAWQYITGTKAMEATRRLRELSGKNERRSFKSTHFDYVTFSGTFSRRGKRHLLKYSGLICLDFDHVLDVEDLFKRLLQDEYFETMLLFRSPSGNGLKWVININTDAARHEEYFQSILCYCRQTYGITPDEQCGDISRACFLPYDPNAYLGINPPCL